MLILRGIVDVFCGRRGVEAPEELSGQWLAGRLSADFDKRPLARGPGGSYYIICDMAAGAGEPMAPQCACSHRESASEQGAGWPARSPTPKKMLILRGKVDVFSCRVGAGAPDRRDGWRVGCWLSGIWQIGLLSEDPGNLSVLTLTAARHKNPSKRNNGDRFLVPSGRSSAEMQNKC